MAIVQKVQVYFYINKLGIYLLVSLLIPVFIVSLLLSIYYYLSKFYLRKANIKFNNYV